MIDIEAGETAGSEDDLYPNPAILVGGAGAIGLISALSLSWPAASGFIVAPIRGRDIRRRVRRCSAFFCGWDSLASISIQSDCAAVSLVARSAASGASYIDGYDTSSPQQTQ
jgi:hypothetical protein